MNWEHNDGLPDGFAILEDDNGARMDDQEGKVAGRVVVGDGKVVQL